ncbi:MAG TPA: hypothetical protein VL749_08350 [Patescibacteria group bacterium]|nr:hypothetical protein [Patescibacteria group bacterium]
MSGSIDVGARARRGSTARRGSGPASPGMPEAAAEVRIAELEARLARLEGGPGIRERSRKMMDRVMPPEASQHFRNAGREQLLGLRSIVDFWIRRIEDADSRARADLGRETIEID